jgi:hypothetical protein
MVSGAGPCGGPARHRRNHARHRSGPTGAARACAGAACRCARPGSGGTGRGRSRDALWPAGCAGQQRRHRGVQAAARHPLRRMAAGAGHQPERPVPVHPSRRAADAEGRWRQRRQHRVDLRPAREHTARGLRHQQGGADPPEQAAGGRAGRHGHPRQLHRARAGGHGHGQAGAQRRHPRRLPRQHSAGPLWHARRDRRRHRLFVQ